MVETIAKNPSGFAVPAGARVSMAWLRDPEDGAWKWFVVDVVNAVTVELEIHQHGD
jgi:hypothetical protein